MQRVFSMGPYGPLSRIMTFKTILDEQVAVRFYEPLLSKELYENRMLQCKTWNSQTLEYEINEPYVNAEFRTPAEKINQFVFIVFMTNKNVDKEALATIREPKVFVKNLDMFASRTSFNTALLRGLAFQYMFMVPLLSECRKDASLYPFVEALKAAINQYVQIYEYASKYGVFIEFSPYTRSNLSGSISWFLKRQFGLYHFVAQVFHNTTGKYLPGMEDASDLYGEFLSNASISGGPFQYAHMLGYLLSPRDYEEFSFNQFQTIAREQKITNIEAYTHGTRNLFEYVNSLPKNLYIE